MQDGKERINVRKIVLSAIVTAIIMSILLYAPSPFVIFQPGLAVSTQNMINLSHEDYVNESMEEKDEEGQFLLTAIQLKTPNILHSVLAIFHSSYDVYWKRDVLQGSTISEYVNRLATVMESSHSAAIEAAYRYMGVTYSLETTSLLVDDVMKLVDQKLSSFEAGDQLLEIKGELEVSSFEQLAEWLQKQELGSEHTFVVKRKNEVKEVRHQLLKVDKSVDSAEYVAQTLGIKGLTAIKGIVAADRSQQVQIDSKAIGGPSAGLVFALSVIDMLSEQQLTGGKVVAVTGTITADGNVGVIGGVKQKVVIADEQGAEWFIVPQGNIKEAKKQAEKMKSSMKIVGVATLEEAVEKLSAANVATD